MTQPPPSVCSPAAIAAPAARRAAALRAVVVAVALGGLGACVAPPRDRGPLLAPSAQEARERTEALLTFAISKDAAGVRGGLCPALASQVPALFQPGQALALDAFTVRGVDPVWVGGEPAFVVGVELSRDGAVASRALRVRAREGCVDLLLDAAPPGAQPPEPDEISL